MIGFPDAYLDIETTGLYADQSYITVIGIYFCNETEGRLVQLFDEKMNLKNLMKALRGTDNLFTYNGKQFDLPFIRMHLGPDLEIMHEHTDLMHDCHRYNLKGGFKAVLKRLGIPRETEGLTGIHAIELWYRYTTRNDPDALNLLLSYNRDDVVNLKQLRERLAVLDRANTAQV